MSIRFLSFFNREEVDAPAETANDTAVAAGRQENDPSVPDNDTDYGAVTPTLVHRPQF